MATYDSADCLARCKRYAKRPSTDQFMSDADWYALLTEAQIETFTDIAARAPHALKSAPALLTTSDSGVTYTFGNDGASMAIFPLGYTEVFAKVNGQELNASTFSEGEGDFVIEGTQIRMPGNRPRTFTDGPYVRYVQAPREISADVEPTLEPAQFRGLLVWKALEKYCLIGPALRDERPFTQQYNALLGKYLLAYRTSMKGSNDPAGIRLNRPWWMHLDSIGGAA